MTEGPVLSDGQRGLGLLALAAAGVVAVIGCLFPGGFLAAPYLLTAGLVAVPQAMQDQPRLYARAALLMGWLLVAVSVAGALLGLFLFLPSALLLLAAAYAGPGRPGLSWTLVAPALAGALIYAVLTPSVDEANEPPPYFQATYDRLDRSREPGFEAGRSTLHEYGGRRMEVYEMAGSLRLTVHFSEQLSPEARDRLSREIARLPGVVSVRLCTFHTC
ncbi:hypothetical protein ACWEQL_30070 [Kitasatospora sp. NPDC004240]